jgi:hypothetical protein
LKGLDGAPLGKIFILKQLRLKYSLSMVYQIKAKAPAAGRGSLTIDLSVADWMKLTGQFTEDYFLALRAYFCLLLGMYGRSVLIERA